MTFQPAPPNTGIRFRRVDLDGQPEIPARLEHVVETTRSTTLGSGSAKVQTVEHVLAAFAGCGVDNAIIELDASEPPIADGSAREYLPDGGRGGGGAPGEPARAYGVTAPLELSVGESLMSVFRTTA